MLNTHHEKDMRIKFWNQLKSFESFLQNSATAVRTWTFPDKDGTVMMTNDVIDEDNFSTDSATRPPSQQSVRVYADAIIGVGTTSGTNSYTVNVGSPKTILTSGYLYAIKWAAASTGAVTLDIQSAGAKKVFKDPTTQAGNGDLVQNSVSLMMYQSNLDGGTGGYLIIGGSSSATVPDADASTKGIGKLYTGTGANTDGSMTQQAITDAIIGVQDLYIPASAFIPRVTNGCSVISQTEDGTSRINIMTLNFDDTTQEYAQVSLKLPRKYNLGTITFQIEWVPPTGTGSVVWSLAGVALGDGDALTTTFGTAVTVTDAAGSSNTLRTTSASSAVTIGNTPADGDTVILQISRVTGDGSDDMTGDAKFKGLWLHITTDAAIDA